MTNNPVIDVAVSPKGESPRNVSVNLYGGFFFYPNPSGQEHGSEFPNSVLNGGSVQE